MLDNIEKQVHRSVDYVSTGTNFLQVCVYMCVYVCVRVCVSACALLVL